MKVTRQAALSITLEQIRAEREDLLALGTQVSNLQKKRILWLTYTEQALTSKLVALRLGVKE